VGIMENYSDLIEAITELKKQGYTEDFNLRENCIVDSTEHYKLFHDDFTVDKYFRFENDTDPGEQCIIYAISSKKYGLKGVLINSYGVYSDAIADELMETLKATPKD
jgi:hypothetical protein